MLPLSMAMLEGTLAMKRPPDNLVLTRTAAQQRTAGSLPHDVFVINATFDGPQTRSRSRRTPPRWCVVRSGHTYER